MNEIKELARMLVGGHSIHGYVNPCSAEDYQEIAAKLRAVLDAHDQATVKAHLNQLELFSREENTSKHNQETY